MGGPNLAGWKLTIPEVSDKGTAASVDDLGRGAPPWMIRDSDGSLRFWAPVAGATTPNSQHARTELVSLTTFTAGTARHTLRASVSVGQVPSAKPDVIIGQVHGAGNIRSVSFVMLHYDGGTIRAVVKQTQSGPNSLKYPLISGVPLGARFDYAISAIDANSIVCTATYGSNSRTATIPIPHVFDGATVRFQAGDYQQADSKAAHSTGSVTKRGGGSKAEDGARVTFYSLVEAHNPGRT
ncbi:MAG TPA: polysaccharide lyase family 7 protein [Pseudonocardia sp.]|jgi:hypothetical protein|uniref:polysaccharide lyase family 7 protein n=1 Tax=Pseudonocardia sp. TaxID=60912 RepID=UPI002F3F5C1D